MRISIVVPTYNTGPYLERLVDSLLAQSLGRDRFEVVFVDDGSTDGTPARLAELAAEHEFVTLHREPNSGWPGRPRNVGMAHARGDYILFLDHDDVLGREALERMLDHADRHRSDVLVPKVSSTMVRPRSLFRETVGAVTLDRMPELMDSLSPHKMFRRAFLEAHALRFPEGPWILEDQLFVSAAYLAAESIGIVGDYPCYYWLRRDDEGNSTRFRFDPRHDFFGNLRTVVAQVRDSGLPADVRDALLHRHLRGEVLSRASEPELLHVESPLREERFEAARKVMAEEFPPSVVDALPGLLRLRAELLAGGDLEGAAELAGRMAGVRAETHVEGVRWSADGVLEADVVVGLRHGEERGGGPVVLERDGADADGAGWLLDPALREGWAVPEPLHRSFGELVVKDRDRGDWWYPLDGGALAVRLDPAGEGRVRPVAAGRLRFDPRVLAGGGPAPRGVHDVWAVVGLLGVERFVRLTLPDAEPSAAAGAPAVVDGRAVLPYWTANRQLAVDVGEKQRRLGRELGTAAAPQGARRGGRRGDRVELPLEAAAFGGGAGGAGAAAGVRGVLVGGREVRGARLAAGEDGRAVLSLPSRLASGSSPGSSSGTALPSGRHTVELPGADRPVGYAVAVDGRLVWAAQPGYRPTLRERLAANPAARAARGAMRKAAGR
ncbi:hypothetical protein BIV57_07820 [Mangrovactinospora gilvigrisea]|uniref:Glycosyltransferase 2-like domain-containing protein n=1 Tax=Mangrovactinospora gilvigrisea TaxID=1428644 RepID=A0A1J7BH97_9ACTN|nr:glycosyltransferase family A protein [Mangrovactinospora gilvigrisea]OIV38063.1 hypothetical protein BIV57_07820 [Mangrovactinospora gilvigrisea]